MRQANCFYLAALIAILCVNFSQQQEQLEDKESEESSEIQDDNPLWPYFYYGSSSDREVIYFMLHWGRIFCKVAITTFSYTARVISL